MHVMGVLVFVTERRVYWSIKKSFISKDFKMGDGYNFEEGIPRVNMTPYICAGIAVILFIGIKTFIEESLRL
jgi:hypothetical protein